MSTNIKINSDSIEFNGEMYYKGAGVKLAEKVDDLDCVLIRTYSAGVHYGYIKEEHPNNGGTSTAVLLNAKRIYSWSGACSLSQIALEGVKNKESTKISVAVPEIKLTQCIEIIKITEEALKNLEEVETWKS